MYQQVYRSEILHAARTFPVCILYLYFEQRLLLTQRWVFGFYNTDVVFTARYELNI